MGKPNTPYCGCDVFVVNSENKVLLIRRTDNNMWALPGGCQNLDETPKDCAIRECFEETGLHVQITDLLGVWSSKCYEYINYPWKENMFTHIVYKAVVSGGKETISSESNEIGWFMYDRLPALSDGHEPRIHYGFNWLKTPGLPPYFE